MHSLYTSFGMSIYEQVAVLLAKSNGSFAKRQHRLLGSIDNRTEMLISDICNDDSHSINKNEAIELVRESIEQADPINDPERTVDVFVRSSEGKELYVDITTVKPNLKEFRVLRKKMLRWCALRFSQDPTIDISTCIGIPYNPYHPAPYERWTSNECDPQELLVQNELWEAFAGYDVFDEMLEIFKEVGEELHEKMAKFLNIETNN